MQENPKTIDFHDPIYDQSEVSLKKIQGGV
jgi:hypothetical protein